MGRFQGHPGHNWPAEQSHASLRGQPAACTAKPRWPEMLSVPFLSAFRPLSTPAWCRGVTPALCYGTAVPRCHPYAAGQPCRGVGQPCRGITLHFGTAVPRCGTAKPRCRSWAEGQPCHGVTPMLRDSRATVWDSRAAVSPLGCGTAVPRWHPCAAGQGCRGVTPALRSGTAVPRLMGRASPRAGGEGLNQGPR